MNKLLFATLLVFSTTVIADGDYTKHEQSLAQLFGRIGGIEKEIRELIEEKNKSHDPEKSHESIAQIKKLMEERKDTIRKYNKEYYHVEYEHPAEMSMARPEKSEKKRKVTMARKKGQDLRRFVTKDMKKKS